MLKKHAKMFNIGIDKHSTIPHNLSVIPAKAGIQEVFLFQTNKRKKEWIPNRVGNDKEKEKEKK